MYSQSITANEHPFLLFLLMLSASLQLQQKANKGLIAICCIRNGLWIIFTTLYWDGIKHFLSCGRYTAGVLWISPMSSWAVIGRRKKRLSVGNSTDTTKEKTYCKKWVLGAGGRAGPTNNLDS
jgi:hypothetical protein